MQKQKKNISNVYREGIVYEQTCQKNFSKDFCWKFFVTYELDKFLLIWRFTK